MVDLMALIKDYTLLTIVKTTLSILPLIEMITIPFMDCYSFCIYFYIVYNQSTDILKETFVSRPTKNLQKDT